MSSRAVLIRARYEQEPYFNHSLRINYLKDLAICIGLFGGFKLIPKKVRKSHRGSIHVVVNIPALEERYAKVSFYSAPFPQNRITHLDQQSK